MRRCSASTRSRTRCSPTRAEYFRRRVLRFPLWQQAAQVAVLLLLVRGAGAAGALRRRRAAAALDLLRAAARRRAAVAAGVGAAAVAAAPAALARRRALARSDHADASFTPARRVRRALRRARAAQPPSASCSSSAAGWSLAARARAGRVRRAVRRASSTCRSSSTRHFQTLAETNRIAIVPIVPNRGVITDRNGVVLAQSYSAYTLEITPSRVRESRRRRSTQLAEIVDVQPRDRKRFKQAARGIEELREPADAHAPDRRGGRALRRQPLPLPRRRDQGAAVPPVSVRRDRLARDRLHRPHQRQATSSASTTGTRPPTTRAPTTSARSASSCPTSASCTARTGVEEVEVDAGGRAVRTLSRTPPTSGNNLRAVDRHRAAAGRPRRRSATAAARWSRSTRRPATCSRSCRKPGFDPNLFVDGIDSANWQELNDSPDKPLLNRPLRGAYPPGSTIKPFLALAALTSGKRTPTQTIFDPGFFQIAGQAHRFRDDKPGGHGIVDMYKSIVVSCDTYYYMLAERDRHRRHRALHDAVRLRRRRPASTSRAS